MNKILLQKPIRCLIRVKFRTKKMAIWLFIILNSNTNFGQAGAALAFDGVNDIISAGNAITTILNDTNKLTVEAWVNASNTTGIKTIVCNHQGAGFAQFDLRIVNNTFDCFVGFGTYIVRAGTVIPNTWQHVAMVFDGATLVMYVDGAIVGTTNTPSYILPNGNATVTMGNNGYAEIFQGRLDEVRIWNRALTQCEIQNNRNAELPAGQTSLLGYYKFNQGTSAGNNTGNIILTDTSGNNNIGFLTNFDLIGTTSNWIAPGGVVTGTNATVFQNLSASAAITNVTCNGGTNGSATVTATGGFGGYSYLWAPSGGTSATATNLSAGNYTCTITSSGCTFTSNVTITQPVTITSAPTALTTQIYAGSGTIANLTATGSSIQWYYTATGGTVLPITTSLVNGAIYYASQTILGCESPTRVAVTVKKISEATQTFCAVARVANLVSTPSAGATASWFTAPSGGAAMVTSATLSTGTYYVEQSSPLTIATLSTAFSSLSGVAVQADGKIVVADAGDGAVVRINADGTGNIPLANVFSGPRSVAVQADGKIVLTDTGNNFIKRMNANGTGIITLGTGFSSPRGVAVQADGKILVADTNNSVIKRMNEDGTGIVTLGTGFSRPNGVAVQADGKILVADSNNFVIKRMNTDGTGIVVVGPSFGFPMGVSLQADGKIVVADAGSTAIKRMNADGTGIVSIGFGFSNPAGVAVQADGKILAVDTSSALKRITEAVFSNRVAVNIVVAAPVSGTTIVTNTSCFGSSNGAINLTPTGGMAPYTFNWGGGITTEDRTGLAAGTYSVIINDANGCTTNTNATVTEPAVINNSVTQASGVLTATQSGAAYQWYNCTTGIIAAATNQTFTPSTVGDYRVTTTLNGCSLDSNCITVTTLSANDFDTANFSYYPNPTTGILNLNYSTDIEAIQVSTILGQVILSKTINAKEAQVDLQFLPSGTYLVKITANDKTKVIKVVKN